ncbi:MAG: glycosyltransferase family 1 protein [Muribaculaceae bacterium]|nr:glycosyltransferase family 1 protein [Muribaculaceae bacterium]
MSKRIHVISFQVPYPADYGGVIDVYYKVKALKDAGYKVALHCFAYKGRKDSPSLHNIADEVYIYKRNTCVLNRMLLKPYIVKSRQSKELLERLLQDNDPILFEGLHTTHLLSSPLLKDRKKFVRAHNIEGEYYKYLADATVSMKKKFFFNWESRRLQRYEKVLSNADVIFAITEKEKRYFTTTYPNVTTELLPCFHNGAEDSVTTSQRGAGKYLLYNGNLSVEENLNAVYFLAERVIPSFPEVKWIIAGGNPPKELYEVVQAMDNVEIIANPSSSKMSTLITEAAANVLITFQSTGIKLKLINALYKGGHCIVNDKMIESTGLKDVCMVTHSDKDLIDTIKKALSQKITDEELALRKEVLRQSYDNDENIKILTKYL